MPDDNLDDVIERLERPASPPELSHLTRRAALAGGGAALAGALLAACGSEHHATAATTSTATNPAGQVFGAQRTFNFTVVNHATSDPVFTATQYGAADACKLLGCKYSWTGSTSSDVSAMIAAINSAVTSGCDGLAVSLIDATAFDTPIQSALRAGVPVVAYNADAPASGRLAYVGQDLEQSGRELGRQIARLLPRGGKVGILVATPGTTNLKPRVAGASAALAGAGFEVSTFATGAVASGEPEVVANVLKTHPRFDGFFAVDGSSTAALGQAIENRASTRRFKAGGFDMSATNVELLAAGKLDFLIDQQLYLQGFLPILELYLQQVSDGLTGPADVDTGIKVHTGRTIAAFISTRSRFAGSSSAVGLQRS